MDATPRTLRKSRARLSGRQRPLILLNGLLLDQAECWHRNLAFWRRSFAVHAPDFLLYDGPDLQQRVEQDLPISVDYLVEQLHQYLQTSVQAPPYALVASSLGAKVAVDYTVRYPDQVARLVLLGPSGFGEEERLPVMQGVRCSDVRVVLQSILYHPGALRAYAPERITAYERRLADRRWRTGLLRTIRGTMSHCVRGQLARVAQPTLVVSGRDDRIVDPVQAEEAARLLPQGWFLSLPCCGHGPQAEKPGLINRLVIDFLSSPHPESPLLTRLLWGQASRLS